MIFCYVSFKSTVSCACCAKLPQSCPTLCDPMDCSPPGSSVHWISQARILEWVAISFSGDLPDAGIEQGSPVWQSESDICVYTHTNTHIHFPGTSDGKESACNAGDPIWIPGLGRSPGKWIGYLLQYPWASLLTQTVKNLHAMREIWVPFLGWEDPPGEGHGNPLQCSCLENPMDRGAWWAMVHEVAESQT